MATTPHICIRNAFSDILIVSLVGYWTIRFELTQNYDYDTFVKELNQMGEYMTKNKSQ